MVVVSGSGTASIANSSVVVRAASIVDSSVVVGAASIVDSSAVDSVCSHVVIGAASIVDSSVVVGAVDSVCSNVVVGAASIADSVRSTVFIGAGFDVDSVLSNVVVGAASIADSVCSNVVVGVGFDADSVLSSASAVPAVAFLIALALVRVLVSAPAPVLSPTSNSWLPLLRFLGGLLTGALRASSSLGILCCRACISCIWLPATITHSISIVFPMPISSKMKPPRVCGACSLEWWWCLQLYLYSKPCTPVDRSCRRRRGARGLSPRLWWQFGTA